MAASQVIMITGANRGIGHAILQKAASRMPDATYLLCCRKPDEVGAAAVAQLRDAGVTAPIDVVRLDVTSNESIQQAVDYVAATYGKLDVLVNNAGQASIPEPTLAGQRENFNKTFDVNVASAAAMIYAFQDLLHAAHPASARPAKVINVSSSRGSITRSASGQMPAARVLAYGVSKAALNLTTVEWQRSEDLRPADDKKRSVAYYAVCPGHCKTAFNRYQGPKDPLDGAEAAVALMQDEETKYKPGSFWEFEGKMQEVPW